MPYRQESELDSNAARTCVHVDIINNGIVTGPIPRRFSMQLQKASVSSNIGIGSAPLVVKIIDSDSKSILM